MKEIIKNDKISLKLALKKITISGHKCLLIVDKNNILMGTLSDGDIRKAILDGYNVNSSIKEIYQKNPLKLYINQYSDAEVKSYFLKNQFDLIPVVDENKKIKKVLYWDEVFGNRKKIKSKNISVIIMAGGEGKRLQPFTSILPKPLIPIGGRTMIDRILDKFHSHGFSKFDILINYKSNIIKYYLEEFKKIYTINFYKEKKPLGTIGGLKLLQNKLSENFFISNSDVIFNLDFNDVYKYHKESKSIITLVVAAKEYTFPYGNCVINAEGDLRDIIEKPSYDFLINTGLYVMNKKILKYIPKNKKLDMDSLVKKLIKEKIKVGIFPIHDDAWSDIGQWDEYKKTLGKLS